VGTPASTGVLRALAAKAKGAAAAVGTVAQMDRGRESVKLAVGDVDFEVHQLVDLAQQADPPTATLSVASLESALLGSDFSLVVSSLRSAHALTVSRDRGASPRARPVRRGRRTPAVNEDRLREENERLGDQLRKDAEALERLRLELEELRRQREYEQQQAEARHDAVVQRAEAAETRVAELDAEICEGILGRLRVLCKGVRGTLQAHGPGAGGR
jgi:hypothetical protein